MRGLAVLAVALALSACSLPLPGLATLTQEEVFEAAKPAVVIVETINEVTWSVPQPALTPQKEQQLRDRLVAMVRAGQLANTQAAIGQAAARLLSDSPGAWFTAGGQRHQQTDMVYSVGSGFLVTEDGYLLTNDHVVETSEDEVKQQILDELDKESGDPQKLASFRDDLSRGLAIPITADQAGRILRWIAGVSRADVRVSSIRPTYRIGFGSMSAKDVQASGLPVELVAHGEVAPGRDVAVLKASGGPYVSLATGSGLPDRGTGLSVVGYPCRCGSGAALDLGHLLTPVLTAGTARERVPMSGGWTALGTDAPIERGNSGGPVLDGSGRVVGLATFSDAGGTGRASLRSFAVPIEVAMDLTSKARVQPAQGALGRQYAQGVAAFHEQHYRAALPLFEQVAASSAHNPYVQRYVDESQAAIAAGRDQTPPPIVDVLPWAAIAVGVIGAVVAAMLFAARRRRRLARF